MSASDVGNAVRQYNFLSAAGEVKGEYVVTSINAYEDVARRLFYDNPNVTKFKSLVTMDRVKVGLSVPLSLD